MQHFHFRFEGGGEVEVVEDWLLVVDWRKVLHWLKTLILVSVLLTISHGETISLLLFHWTLSHRQTTWKLLSKSSTVPLMQLNVRRNERFNLLWEANKQAVYRCPTAPPTVVNGFVNPIYYYGELMRRLSISAVVRFAVPLSLSVITFSVL